MNIDRAVDVLYTAGSKLPEFTGIYSKIVYKSLLVNVNTGGRVEDNTGKWIHIVAILISFDRKNEACVTMKPLASSDIAGPGWKLSHRPELNLSPSSSGYI